MYRIKIDAGHHDWEKQNLITISKGRKSYDIVKCKGCKIEGKRINLDTVEITSKYSESKVKVCSAYKAPDNEIADLNSKYDYFVAQSPWPSKLPVGTKIVMVEPRKGKEDSVWYAREDGKLLYNEETDGKFVLYSSEVNAIEK